MVLFPLYPDFTDKSVKSFFVEKKTRGKGLGVQSTRKSEIQIRVGIFGVLDIT